MAAPFMNLRSFLAPVLAATLIFCGPISRVYNQDGPRSRYLAGVGVTSTLPTAPVNPAESSKFWDGASLIPHHGVKSAYIQYRDLEASWNIPVSIRENHLHSS